MGASLREAVRSSGPGKAIASKGDLRLGYLSIGTLLGALVALATFVVVWVSAAGAGILGILFGWIPAGIAAGLAFWIVAFLWAPLLLIGAIIWAGVSKQHDAAVVMPNPEIVAASSVAADMASAVDGSGTGPAVPPRPSFDCTKALSIAAKAICADAELAALDQTMAVAYSARSGLDPSLKPRQAG